MGLWCLSRQCVGEGKMKINILGSSEGVTGYAIHTKELTKALNKLGVETYSADDIGSPCLAITMVDYLPLHSGNRHSPFVVYVVHEGDKIPNAWIDILNKDYINKIVTPNNKTSDLLKSAGITKDILVAPHGVDTSLFYPATEKVGKNVKILYVGQLTSSKGVEDLLEVFSDLVEGIGYMELIIAGSGPLSDKITKLAQKYPISYRGFVDYRALPKLYREADIFCSPSKYISFLGLKIWEEFFSYTLMEAMASGLPIIATYSGGIPEELGENNLLVDPGDKIQLSAALSKLVTDGKLRRKLGSLNRKRAEKFFDLAKQSRQTEEAILSLL